MDYDFDIYIAGPMTGRPLFNHPAFNAAEAKYAALGYRVFNPAKNGLPPESPWREHMRVDIAALLRSRSVVLLDGWMDSRGANIEHDIAAAVGAPLFLDRIVAEDDLRSILGEPLAPKQAQPAVEHVAEASVLELADQLKGGAAFPAYPPMPLREAASVLLKQHEEIVQLRKDAEKYRLRVEIAQAQIEHGGEGAIK